MSPIILHAGPLQLAFSSTEGSIRYIYAGEHEILRGISAPVRDDAWATIAPKISDLAVVQEDNSFAVTFTARCRSSLVDFIWQGKIAGSSDGTLVFDFEGEALGDFRRNRVGFCVLHGAEVSGQACEIEHADGSREQGTFPTLIHSGAPFSRIRAITHRIKTGLDVEVRFEGDVFEMEDQRNWTDASFKTYCTPLAEPRPVFIAKGTRITQHVTIRLHGTAEKPRATFSPPWRTPGEVELTIGAPLGWRLPLLGTIWNKPAEPADQVIANLRSLSLSHLRVDLWLDAADYPLRLRSVVAAADKLEVALELAVIANDNIRGQIARLLAELGEMRPAPRIIRWLVYDQEKEATTAAAVTEVRAALSGSSFAAPVGGGAPDNFAELNRHPEVATAGDFTVHACNPQVHAFDEASMIETIAQQGTTVANARHLSAGRPVMISPLTLTRRWRINEVGAPAGLPAAAMPFQIDSRQRSNFAVAWTLGSLSSLAQQGAASVTGYEAVGENGLLASDGLPHPIHGVFKLLAPFVRGAVVATDVSHPLSLAALALADNERRILLVANLRNESQSVKIRGSWGDHSIELSPYRISSIPCASPVG